MRDMLPVWWMMLLVSLVCNIAVIIDWKQNSPGLILSVPVFLIGVLGIIGAWNEGKLE